MIITTNVVSSGIPLPKINEPSLKATTALNASTPKRIEEVKQNERTNGGLKAEISETLLYLSGEKYLGDSTLNLGINAQRVISKQTDSYNTQDNLIGGELGYHYQIHPQVGVFTSYSRTFVTPNVDWLLRYDPITSIPSPNDTATFDTFQIGTNAVFGIHKLSGSVFYIQGHDENYYDPNIGAFWERCCSA